MNKIFYVASVEMRIILDICIIFGHLFQMIMNQKDGNSLNRNTEIVLGSPHKNLKKKNIRLYFPKKKLAGP